MAVNPAIIGSGNIGTDLIFKALCSELINPLWMVDRDPLILGYTGVYASFLLHAKRAGAKYKVRSSAILVEPGRRKTIGGPEDMIEDVALNPAEAARAEAAP